MATIIGTIHRNGKEFIPPYRIKIDEGWEHEQRACQNKENLGGLFATYEEAANMCLLINLEAAARCALSYLRLGRRPSDEDRARVNRAWDPMNLHDQFYYELLSEAGGMLQGIVLELNGREVSLSTKGEYCILQIQADANQDQHEVNLIISTNRGGLLDLSPYERFYATVQSLDGKYRQNRYFDKTGLAVFEDVSPGKYTFTIYV